jgi:molybdopterin/thiamine biosynthesis adenylyltransferase
VDTDSLISNEFSRNIGIVNEAEQRLLLAARVAVAGAGGVGGLHILTLARLGIGNFTIADFDVFEPANINLQFGAMRSTMGKHKAQVIAGMAKDINHLADVRIFEDGVNEENLDAFLADVDIFVDGIDFFEIEIRRAVFKKCREKGIYALTSAPLGFGATLQVFSPTGMGFDEYFGIHDRMSQAEKVAAFAAGLAPNPYHMAYMDMSKVVSLEKKRGPALAVACTQASSLISTEVIKILTGKGTIRPVPAYLQIDLLRNKYTQGYLWLGGRNPIQMFKRWMILKKISGKR